MWSFPWLHSSQPAPTHPSPPLPPSHSHYLLLLPRQLGLPHSTVKFCIMTNPVQHSTLKLQPFCLSPEFFLLFYVTPSQATLPLCDHLLPSPAADHISRFRLYCEEESKSTAAHFFFVFVVLIIATNFFFKKLFSWSRPLLSQAYTTCIIKL